MAALNASFSLKISLLSLPELHPSASPLSTQLHPPHPDLQNLQLSGNQKHGLPLSNLGKPIASTSLIALLSASLCFAHPALASREEAQMGRK